MKIGMYVRCQVEDDSDFGPSRRFYYGQVTALSAQNGLVTVTFYDLNYVGRILAGLLHETTTESKNMKRSYVHIGTIGIYKESEVVVRCIGHIPTEKDPDSFYSYFIEFLHRRDKDILEVNESEIEFSLTSSNYNPIKQIYTYELHHPKWYLKRRVVRASMHMIENAPFGFSNILNTRIQMFSHQIDTVIRGLMLNKCRLMLADEVGLGKTIEAVSIIKGMIDRQSNYKCLIIVPNTLIYQWQTEIVGKFWLEAPIYGIEDIKNKSIIIVSYEMFIQNYANFDKQHLDMIVVDETHKLLRNDELYDKIRIMSAKVNNILLLSATPILQRGDEYRRLLTLLNPLRYQSMTEGEFSDLLSKQNIIKNEISDLVRDEDKYVSYELYDDYKKRLIGLSNLLQDPNLERIVNDIDVSLPDKGFSNVKVALAYVSEFYQIDRGIIRHRKKEIDSSYIIRGIDERPRFLGDQTIGFSEKDIYYDLIDFYSKAKILDIQKAKHIMGAFLSSPFAFKVHLDALKKEMTSEEYESLITLTSKWENEVLEEIKKSKTRVMKSSGSKFGQLIHVIEEIEKSGEKEGLNPKYLIFTGYSETVEHIERILELKYKEESVVSFHYGKTPEEMQDAADYFQSEPKCKFMICDESGGEGRNFQLADYIIHFDLPWSPAMLEQRIGRLDRIGRNEKRDVVSIVLYSKDSIEEDLFELFSTGMNIFEESLCGIEIAFEHIQEKIDKELSIDIKYGLKNVLPNIKTFVEEINKEVERERYYDKARQLDKGLSNKLDQLISHFTENDCENLMETMMSWPEMAGFRGLERTDLYNDLNEVIKIKPDSYSLGSINNSLYVPPETNISKDRFNRRKEIIGTFSRIAAVEHENLQFFAPGNALFDSITNNALESYKGRSTAFKYYSCPINWSGFVVKWNIRYNPKFVLNMKANREIISLVMKFMPNEQITQTYSFDAQDKPIDIVKFERIIWNKESIDIDPIHLGKRENGIIKKFVNQTNPQTWANRIKEINIDGLEKAKETSKMFIDLIGARKELEQLLIVKQARKIFYGFDDEFDILNTQEQIEALLKGLEKPLFEIDSIIYVNFTTEMRRE